MRKLLDHDCYKYLKMQYTEKLEEYKIKVICAKCGRAEERIFSKKSYPPEMILGDMFKKWLEQFIIECFKFQIVYCDFELAPYSITHQVIFWNKILGQYYPVYEYHVLNKDKEVIETFGNADEAIEHAKKLSIVEPLFNCPFLQELKKLM